MPKQVDSAGIIRDTFKAATNLNTVISYKMNTGPAKVVPDYTITVQIKGPNSKSISIQCAAGLAEAPEYIWQTIANHLLNLYLHPESGRIIQGQLEAINKEYEIQDALDN